MLSDPPNALRAAGDWARGASRDARAAVAAAHQLFVELDLASELSRDLLLLPLLILELEAELTHDFWAGLPADGPD